MFQNKKIKQLQDQLNNAHSEIKLLQDFNKKIDDKIEELCKPKIDAYFCSRLVGSGSGMNIDVPVPLKNKQYESLQELLTSQAKKIEQLEKSEEDTKKILFLAGRVEQLLNQLKKGK